MLSPLITCLCSIDRIVLEDILNDVESASKKDPTLLGDAAREDLKQMRLMLDMARDAILYAKEAKETYELLQKVCRSPIFISKRVSHSWHRYSAYRK